jgi:tetratricopeptide (TPR) repeat protein
VLRGNLPLFFLMTLLAVASAGQTAGIAGVVYSEGSNERVVHASLGLWTVHGGILVAEAVTTDRGEFAFNVADGAYILKIAADGFAPLEMDVTADFHSSIGISIFLRPAGKKSAGEAPGGSAISAHELSIPSSARKLVDSGKKKLYVDQNPGAALHDFQLAVATAPDYYEAYYQIGMAYLALKNPVEAESNLKKSVDLSNQSYADAILALAILQLGRHDVADGEPLLRRCLELNPNSWVGQYELGKLELYRMRIDAALAAARKAEALAPNQPKVYHLLSLIHLRQKAYQAAVADLDAYIRLDPDSPDGQTAKQIRADAERKLANSHP